MGKKHLNLFVTSTVDTSNGGHYYERIVNNSTGKTKVKEVTEPSVGVQTVRLTNKPLKLEVSDGKTKTTTTAGRSENITTKAPAEYDTSQL